MQRGRFGLYTYLMASAPYGTLYCGHTDSLMVRVVQHRDKVRPGFTSRYGIDRLVWYEFHDTRLAAFEHERRIKKWNRAWKVRIIEETNPNWDDLYDSFMMGTTVISPTSLGSPPSRG